MSILTESSAGAEISHCGLYRYRLWRQWGLGNCVVFVMLNPSTADGQLDDPTIRRCIGFARDWGYGGIEVVNLYAFRATDPKALLATENPVGAENDARILEAVLHNHGPVLAAWGDARRFRSRANYVRDYLTKRRALRALGVTKNGDPRHPLYVRRDVCPMPWPYEAVAHVG